MHRLYNGGRVDLQRALGKAPGFIWSRFPGKKHLPGHSFTGPGTRLDKRLYSDDSPITKPINRIDAAALKHDLFYRDHPDTNDRHLADQQMIQELKDIPNPTFREKVERALVIRLLQGKMKLGMGYDAVGRGYADELHHEFRKPKHLLKVKVFNKDDIWSADLVEMPKEGKFKYILTVIDLYTRYAWAIPLPDKKGQTVAQAFQAITNESGRKPNKVWVDKGTEFYNQHVKALPFEIYSTANDGKAVVIERFNRTLKQMMFKKFTSQGDQRWNKILPEILERYNNKVHSSIKTTPVKASEDPNSISGITLRNNSENELTLPQRKPKFKLGQRVRIFKWKSKFEKGYTAKWTQEIFIVKKINNTAPITYELEDQEGEDIVGRFYEKELQATDY